MLNLKREQNVNVELSASIFGFIQVWFIFNALPPEVKGINDFKSILNLQCGINVDKSLRVIILELFFWFMVS